MKTKTLKIADLLGKFVSFNNGLKLYHWHVTGDGSYAQHMAIDEALDSLLDAADSLVETQYAVQGDLNITIPSTSLPENIIKYIEDFYSYIDVNRELFDESFTQGIIDSIKQTLQQLLYRLKRLK